MKHVNTKKRGILTCILLLVLSLINTQQLLKAQDKLWGMTYTGGANNGGTLFGIAPNGSAYEMVFDFVQGSSANFPYGKSPVGDLLSHGGYLWGMTSAGGATGFGGGVIFRFDPGNKQMSTYAFPNQSTGKEPRGNLIAASDGKLYGLTRFGGSSDKGTLFCVDPATFTHTKIFEFAGSNGESPMNSLFEHNGALYGTTRFGGQNNHGVIFKYTLNTGIVSVLHSFNGGSEGSQPFGNLIEGGGKLWGMAKEKGSSNAGTLYSITPSGTFTVEYTFNTYKGIKPYGDLEAYSSYFYGMTNDAGPSGNSGNGTIFRFTPSTGNYQAVLEFNSSLAGGLSNPRGELYQYGSNMYGMCRSGGSNGSGGIFYYHPNTGISLLYSFKGSGIDGALPQGSLVHHCAPQKITGQVSDTVLCAGEEVRLFAPDGFTNISWTGGISDSVAFTAPTNLTAYVLTGTDACNVVSSDTISIQANALPQVQLNASDSIACTGDTVAITANGADTYTWNQGLQNGTSHNVGLTTTTTFVVQGTDTSTTCTSTDSLTVQVLTYPQIQGSANTSSICAGDTVSLTASGATTFEWWLVDLAQGQNTLLHSGAQTTHIPTASAVYMAVGNPGPCSASDTVEVNWNPVPNPTVTLSQGNILQVAGTYTSYQWYADQSQVAGATDSSWTAQANGVYHCVVTDTNGCSGSSSTQTVLTVHLSDVQHKVVNVYPNPFRDMLNIEIPVDAELLVFDALGRLQAQHQLTAGKHQLQLRHLPQGQYNMQLITPENTQVITLIKH